MEFHEKENAQDTAEVVLETQRLLLRRLTFSDAPFLIELLNSPGWLQYIGDKNVKTEEQAIGYLQNGPLKSYAEHGFGLYLVVRKESQVSIGICGLLKRETLDWPDLGFAFLSEFQGLGFAFESAVAVVQFGMQQLHMHEMAAITKPDNLSSKRLLEKLGFQREGSIAMHGTPDPLLLYKISAVNTI
ncbi:MAG: GNAT family N-acetyltransferase [Saprospiraceae bacterium]|nr:GNAT family N-acetyltransferase [Saprospiraceae bacterium]